ncbi:O-antigen ligase domain-containing protein [Roseococcus sp. DSY-14]|uniref:O-antigen ligase domain-containing protein n=1 Tax=Roseococcus sp. DSY-14 TaxID=3369650 RepID=UPI00387B4281
MTAAVPALAALAGLAGAALQAGGALKSVPPFAHAPLDVTLLAFAAALALLAPLLAGRRWVLHRALALPLAGCAGLWLWWVLAAAWSPWAAGAADRLPEVALAGPVLLLLGLVLGAEDASRRALAGATLAIGLFTGAALAWGLATDALVLGGAPGQDPTRVRVAYQVAGLAIATAAGLAALRLAMARGWAARAAWAAATAALAGAVLLPGGRAAFAILGLGVALVPAAWLWLHGRRAAALLWPAAAALLAALALAALLLDEGRAAGLATLERLTDADGGGVDGARRLLWGTAWGAAGWWGLGPGGFPVLAGMGQARGFHPHNHGIEALLEGGAVGFALWLLAFGGGLLVLLARAPRVAPRRAAEVLALVLPVACTVMVSTDLGNRMAWFALGLALSLAVSAGERGQAGV